MRHEYKRLIGIWLALLLLLLLTFGSAYLRLGAWNSIINFAIATMKAALVALFFMHLWRAGSIIRLTVAIAFFTVALMLGLSASDYATRDMYRTPLHLSPASRQVG